ncbi:MAG: hypothetical protein ACE145_00560 [Terriglobia bacterium]
MTFLTTRYKLAKATKPRDFERLNMLSTVYGIRGVSFEGQDLVVEYDASRIHEAEVLGTVRRLGIGVEPSQPIPPGSFDYQGEFKDFAWPTTGISSANRPVK